MPAIPESKTCCVCKLDKPSSEFHKCAWKGIRSNCKKCNSKRNHKKRADLIRQYKARIIENYGGKCSCCQEPRYEFLTIDHVHNDGASHRRQLKSQGIDKPEKYYKWIIDSGFPTSLRILCFNCNCARGSFGYCPHEKERQSG